MVFDHLDIFKKLDELKYFSAPLHSFNRKKCDEDDYDDRDHDHQQQLIIMNVKIKTRLNELSILFI